MPVTGYPGGPRDTLQNATSIIICTCIVHNITTSKKNYVSGRMRRRRRRTRSNLRLGLGGWLGNKVSFALQKKKKKENVCNNKFTPIFSSFEKIILSQARIIKMIFWMEMNSTYVLEVLI